MPRTASEVPRHPKDLRPRVVTGRLGGRRLIDQVALEVLDGRLYVPTYPKDGVLRGSVVAYNHARTVANAKEAGLPTRQAERQFDYFEDPFQYLGTLELVARRKRRDAAAIERLEGELEELLPLTWLLQIGYTDQENPFVAGMRAVSASPLLAQPLDERLRGAAKFARAGQSRIDASGRLNDGRLPLYVWPTLNRLASRRHGDLAITAAFDERALAMGFVIEAHLEQMRMMRRVAVQALASRPTLGPKRTHERRYTVAARWDDYATECSTVALRPFCHSMTHAVADFRSAATWLRTDDSIWMVRQRLDVIARSMLLTTRYRMFLFRLRVALCQLELHGGTITPEHAWVLSTKMAGFIRELSTPVETQFGGAKPLDTGFKNPVISPITSDLTAFRPDTRSIRDLKDAVDAACKHF